MRVYAFCPLSVGTLFRRVRGSASVCVIVKVTCNVNDLSTTTSELVLGAEQVPLGDGVVSRFRARGLGMRDFDTPSDWVPGKAAIDVAAVGHAFAFGGPSASIAAGLRVAALSKEVRFLLPEPALSVPMVTELEGDDGGLGPIAPPSLELTRPENEIEARISPI